MGDDTRIKGNDVDEQEKYKELRVEIHKLNRLKNNFLFLNLDLHLADG